MSAQCENKSLQWKTLETRLSTQNTRWSLLTAQADNLINVTSNTHTVKKGALAKGDSGSDNLPLRGPSPQVAK